MLMDLPRNVFPNIFEMIRIGFTMKFGMRKIDPDFKYSEFSKGAQQVNVTIIKQT